MTLHNICKNIALTHECSVDHLYDVVRRIMAGIESRTLGVGRCFLRGFGGFYRVERAARMGRNPRTGEPVPIGSRVIVKFRQERHAASDSPAPKNRTPMLNSVLGRICTEVAMHYERKPEDVLRIAQDVLLGIVEEARLHGRCIVRGFGVFRMRTTAARMARNPRTGEPAVVSARTQMVFSYTGKDHARTAAGSAP